MEREPFLGSMRNCARSVTCARFTAVLAAVQGASKQCEVRRGSRRATRGVPGRRRGRLRLESAVLPNHVKGETESLWNLRLAGSFSTITVSDTSALRLTPLLCEGDGMIDGRRFGLAAGSVRPQLPDKNTAIRGCRRHLEAMQARVPSCSRYYRHGGQRLYAEGARGGVVGADGYQSGERCGA